MASSIELLCIVYLRTISRMKERESGEKCTLKKIECTPKWLFCWDYIQIETDFNENAYTHLYCFSCFCAPQAYFTCAFFYGKKWIFPLHDARFFDSMKSIQQQNLFEYILLNKCAYKLRIKNVERIYWIICLFPPT